MITFFFCIIFNVTGSDFCDKMLWFIQISSAKFCFRNVVLPRVCINFFIVVPLTGACAFAQSSSNANPARTGKIKKRALFAGLRFEPLKRHQKNTREGCFFGAADRGLRDAQSSSNANSARTGKIIKRALFAGLQFEPLKRHQKNTREGCFFGAADRTRTGTKFYFRGIFALLYVAIAVISDVVVRTFSLP